MSILAPQQFETLLPLACAWAAEQERVILQSGVALTEAQIADARRVGVTRPERVRLLRIPEIPTPRHPALAAAAEATSLISPFTLGLTLRYGIFIRDDHWGQRRLVVHELAHTMQYERIGSIDWRSESAAGSGGRARGVTGSSSAASWQSWQPPINENRK